MNVSNMNGKLSAGVQWLPCMEITLNDAAECNGWVFVKRDDEMEPSIEGVYLINVGQWVDEVIPAEKWEGTRFLFMSIIVDPTDFPYSK